MHIFHNLNVEILRQIDYNLNSERRSSKMKKDPIGKISATNDVSD